MKNAYIFDLDGTLLDSMHVWEQIDVDFLTNRGFAVPEDYMSTISAMSFVQAAAYTIQRFSLSDSVPALLQEWNNMAAYAYGHTVRLKPHALEYLTALKARGAALGIATSLPPALYEPALRNLDILSLFDAICSVDEVSAGKTQPDVFLLSAKKLGAAPEHCIVFEDIPEAIQSAKRAGMTVYGMYDEASKAHWPQIQKTADGALYDFSDAPLPK